METIVYVVAGVVIFSFVACISYVGYRRGMDHAYSNVASGVLIVANAEIDEEPYMLLNLDETASQIAERHYVIFKVDSTHYSR